MISFSDVTEFFLKLEGPYKWYALGGVLLLITAFVTRFIFKTFKWFLLIVTSICLVAGAAAYFFDINILGIVL